MATTTPGKFKGPAEPEERKAAAARALVSASPDETPGAVVADSDDEAPDGAEAAPVEVRDPAADALDAQAIVRVGLRVRSAFVGLARSADEQTRRDRGDDLRAEKLGQRLGPRFARWMPRGLDVLGPIADLLDVGLAEWVDERREAAREAKAKADAKNRGDE